MKRRPKGTGTIEKTRDGRFRARLSFKPGVREDVEGSPFLTYEEAERALDALLFELRSYETHRKLNKVHELSDLAGLARAYALAVARGAPDAHVLGLRLAEAVLDLDIRAQEAAS